MTNASLLPNGAMTNGLMANGTTVHQRREVDGSSHSQPPSSLRDVCADLHTRVSAFLSSTPPDETTRRTQVQTKIALGVIEKALQDYEFRTMSLSYNGGKDCLVLLILYLAALYTHFTRSTRHPSDPSSEPFPTSIPSIYAKPPDPFPAVSSFVESSAKAYHLDLTHISTNPDRKPRGKSHSNPPLSGPLPTISQLKSSDGSPLTPKPTISFRDAFALYLASHPSIKAIFVGTRRTDPHGSRLTHFDPTDHNWPAFMRIHPVIDWHLSEIWCFLRSPHLADPKTGKPLEYCSMYDEGYTSLGGVNDTLRNPKLRYYDKQGNERYRPAYEMTEDDVERLGRE